MGLGVFFNIVSYVLFMYMIVYIMGLKLGDFVYILGDVYIYLNYIELLKIQFQ